MRALIMAGGSGSRLARGEKPLTIVCGKPMISYVTDAFRAAGHEPVAITSQKTPMTANWCRAHGIAVVRTNGGGFIDDMASAVRILEEDQPLFISVSDIPCLTPLIIETILQSYHDCRKDALSTWVPAARVRACRGSILYREWIHGVVACPAGINILRGDRMDSEQEEYALLLDEPGLAFNVNTSDDLSRTEAFLISCQTG